MTTSWDHKDPVSPALLPSLFADAGLARDSTEEQKAWEATRDKCCEVIRDGGYSMGDIGEYAMAFYAGYMACAQSSGL